MQSRPRLLQEVLVSFQIASERGFPFQSPERVYRVLSILFVTLVRIFFY